MSELPVMGSPWAWLAMDGLGFVIYIYIFQILVQIFFGFFFLLESRTDNFFFNLMVFLIFDWGLRELVGNGWRGRLWNVGGAYFFFSS